MKPKTCKQCKSKFTPQYNSLQVACSPLCAVELAIKENRKKADKKLKELKSKIKTHSELQNELQIEVNKLVRIIDDGNKCVSCGKEPKKINAGHYYSVGSNNTMRYNLLNNWLQCEHCNTYLHGNLDNYRLQLIRWGFFERLEEDKLKFKSFKLLRGEIEELLKIVKGLQKTIPTIYKDKPRTIDQRIGARLYAMQEMNIYI